MSEPRWVKRARKLDADGVSCAEIARRVGKTYSAVYKRLHPDATAVYNVRDNGRRRTEKTEWERNRRATDPAYGKTQCVACGEPAKKDAVSERCAPCVRRARRAARVERVRQLEHLWRAGLPIREIADLLGVPKGTVQSDLDWGRNNGYDIPHRYQVKDRAAA
jgi:transposase